MTFAARILLATDGSTTAALARERAVELARYTGAELHVVHVALASPWTTPRPLGEQHRSRLLDDARPVLDAEVAAVRRAGLEAEPHLRLGRPPHEVLRVQDEIGADLVVIGSRGLNAFSRVLLGDDAETILRHAPCDVLVVRPASKEQ
jgi:nucleotide-binding universal stress UspA family protein